MWSLYVVLCVVYAVGRGRVLVVREGEAESTREGRGWPFSNTIVTDQFHTCIFHFLGKPRCDTLVTMHLIEMHFGNEWVEVPNSHFTLSH